MVYELYKLMTEFKNIFEMDVLIAYGKVKSNDCSPSQKTEYFICLCTHMMIRNILKQKHVQPPPPNDLWTQIQVGLRSMLPNPSHFCVLLCALLKKAGFFYLYYLHCTVLLKINGWHLWQWDLFVAWQQK